MSQLFRNKAIGFYIGILAGLAALALDISYFVMDYGDKTFSMWAFALVVAAVVAEGLILFLDWAILPLVPPILMGAAVGMHLYTAFPSISDLINNIVFIGGNSKSISPWRALCSSPPALCPAKNADIYNKAAVPKTGNCR